MDNKDYKRIPVSPSTKKQFDIAKVESGCGTQDEFINELLICRDILSKPQELHFVKFPSFELGLKETEGRIWITRGTDNPTWVDITKIINDLETVNNMGEK